MTTNAASSNPFYWRAFVSLIVVIAFLILAVTGIALYATPPGRIANWSGWTLLGVTKTQWQAVHMTFGFLFLVAAAFHLVFNWKVLLHYLRSRSQDGLRRKREIAWAAVATMSVTVLAFIDVPPISYISTGRETLANSWSSASLEPPVPHAELMTVAQVAASMNIATEVARERLQRQGFAAPPDSTLEVIAAAHDVTPQVVYAALRPTATPPTGTGMGWKTMEQIAGELGVPLETAQARLHAVGIAAAATDTLRDIAQRHGRHTPELYQVVSGASH